ncbi:transmembrane adaptor Erv26-domain-containing protein [Flagelloscypha sp. PMI_526]|nr:transmembrane adaptor Erv26-domain-containing protein [Flagelloscypha sp. PMI_526]
MMLYYLSLFAGVVAFAFVVLSLASGLLYVAELIEEHSRLAKTIGQRAIYGIIALHGLLYLFDQLPFNLLAFSALCHVVYLQNFSSQWPIISLTSWTFIASAILVIVDHFLWFFYFSRLTAAARHQRNHYRYNAPTTPGFSEISTFFGICVWLVPLFLFLSLSANDNALPVSGSDGKETSVSAPNARVSLFRSMFSIPGGRSRRHDEGLLAPHTPSSPRPQPLLSPSLNDLVRGDPFIPPPPRSPGGSRNPSRIGSPELPPHFELRQPPMRQGSTSSSEGLGLRRAVRSDDERSF